MHLSNVPIQSRRDTRRFLQERFPRRTDKQGYRCPEKTQPKTASDLTTNSKYLAYIAGICYDSDVYESDSEVITESSSTAQQQN